VFRICCLSFLGFAIVQALPALAQNGVLNDTGQIELYTASAVATPPEALDLPDPTRTVI
jgi:hypothetical protein